MPTDVLMPQMGESIAEGTIVRWLKEVGERVDRDEPLFEISTDKVDAEIPSPAGGLLARVCAEVGATVPVNSVVAVIAAAGESLAVPDPDSSDPPAADGIEVLAGGAAPVQADARPEITRRRLSPVVRRLAEEHGVDPSVIVGTGADGRVSKADVLAFVSACGTSQGESGPGGAGAGVRVERMNVMRRRIAEHMVTSRQTAAHVHTVFEVDFSRVAALRAERAGSQPVPGYLAYIAEAVCKALVAMPVVNASVDGDAIVYHEHVNLGVAVALDGGLIVPVIKGADQLGVELIDAAVADLSTRARSKRLVPEDVDGGTFTITNPGVFGSVFGLPIINQPQSAILCVGAIEKRPVVVSDEIVVRHRGYLTLGFDHRLIDGAVADQFLACVRDALENAVEMP